MGQLNKYTHFMISETIKKKLLTVNIICIYLYKNNWTKVNQTTTTESKTQYEKSVRFFGQHFYVTVNNNSKNDSKIEACEKSII